MKKGRPYYYIREIARVDGKPTVVNQVYLGSVERILEMASGKGQAFARIQSQEFGALWLANLIDQDVGIASLIDSVIPKGKGESGPSVGEYFLYAAFNRMVDSCSKRALPDWFSGTAIQAIRPVKVDELSSQRYWDKWDRVKAEDIEEIAGRFFAKVAELATADEVCAEEQAGRLTIRFRKNYHRIGKHCERFGKNITITDSMAWETGKIIQASLDRHVIERSFRCSKDDDLVSMAPVRHWTDSKIRCHILTCIIALTYLRLVEIRLKRAGYLMTAATAMTNMRRLHSCLLWGVGMDKPTRIVEEPTEIQAKILKAFGYAVETGGVLRKVSC